jgi:flagellar hook-associated protein 1 FlgK
MDEELAKMLTYQRSYQAAARLMTTYDNLLEGLLETIGR